MQRVYFDELQDFEWSQFEYLFQRVRANETITVPWAVRAGAMPGGVGQDWVRERFVLRGKPDANKPWIPDNDNNTPAFVPALSTDNPHLSRDYETKSLANLDAFTRASRGKGDWSITPDGNLFKREWFPIVERLPDLFNQSVRFWDFAATEKKPGKNPDATASVKMHICGKVIYVSDVTETFLSPGATQAMMRNTAIADGIECAVRWEEELGSSGAHATSLLQRHSLPEFNADGVRVSGDKVERAKPFSAASEKRLVYLVRGDWNQMFLTRMCGFPVGKRDVTDATSGAFAYLQENAIAAAVVHDEGDERRTQTSKVRTMMGLGLRARRMR
jgi:predicted phage terminase large subunit-like protein